MYNPQETFIRIKRRARELGISMTQINEECSLSDNAIAHSAKSQNGMKAKNIFMIADILSCSTDYLLGKTDNPNLLINISDNNNNNISINSDKVDDTTQQFFMLFKTLSLENKIKLLCSAMQLKKEESK